MPFIYGISRAESLHADLLLSPPSGCARTFADGKADVALVPIGALPTLEDYRIITPYCIGAEGPVRTVTLMTDKRIGSVKRIWLDPHSMTSALLVQILSKYYWDIKPEFFDMEDYSPVEENRPGDAFLLIGDKVFDYEGRFVHSYDLASQWIANTKLPFVFAVWIARNDVPQDFVDELSDALGYGVAHIPQAIEYYGHSGKAYAKDYLTNNINYLFDAQKSRALSLYWAWGRKFVPRIDPG